MDIISQNKFLMRLVILLAFLNLALLVFFGWRYFNRKQKKEDKRVNNIELASLLKKELGFTNTQADSLNKIRTAFFEKEKLLTEETRAKRDSMNQLMFSTGNNDEVLKRLAAGVAENEQKMELLRIEQASQVRNMCNAEQLRKLEELVREIRDYLKPDEKQSERKK